MAKKSLKERCTVSKNRVSSIYSQGILVQMHGTMVLKVNYDDNGFSNEIKIYQNICLNFTYFDIIGDAILNWRNLLVWLNGLSVF